MQIRTFLLGKIHPKGMFLFVKICPTNVLNGLLYYKFRSGRIIDSSEFKYLLPVF